MQTISETTNMKRIQEAVSSVDEFVVDLGNSNVKVLFEDKKLLEPSNVEEVKKGTFGSLGVNGKYYIFGGNARKKKTTNKICIEKKALLGKTLFPLVKNEASFKISTLLPLSLYVEDGNRDVFSKLFKGKYKVTDINGVQKEFTITSVDVCAESYSSLVTHGDLLKKPIYLIDIGGVDVSGVYVNETPDVDKSFTHEKGMNIFFTQLGKALTSKLPGHSTYTDKDAEQVYKNYDDFDEGIRKIIDTFSVEYIKENIMDELSDIGFKSLIHELVFVGGGAVALERYLTKIEGVRVRVLPNALWANVQGARIISNNRNR